MQDNTYESQCEVHSVSLNGSLEASSLCREIDMGNDFYIYMVIPLFSGHSTTDCNDVFACNIWYVNEQLCCMLGHYNSLKRQNTLRVFQIIQH